LLSAQVDAQNGRSIEAQAPALPLRRGHGEILFADSYYVVQDAKTKKCTITQTKPTTTETTVVGDGTVYKTRSEAETGMKAVKVCTSN
jgi:hypothetical protein